MSNAALQNRGLRQAKRVGETGQAIVEMALTMSVLTGLLFGAAELARVAYVAIEVSNAAMAGVQYGAQSGSTASDTTGIQTAAQNDAPNITLATPTVSISYICSDGTASTGLPGDCPNSHIEESVTVNTQTTFSPLIHLPGLPLTYTLRGRATQKCSQ